MDPQFALASKDDVWRLQNEMKNVYATQAEHADRLARLEQQRQEVEARMKSPWGTTSHSPFHGPVNGTPQQERNYNPVSEDFRNFDQNLLGGLHLDTEDVEPRRGTSRANSVRFDVSASGPGVRGSQDYLPLRTGSAFGSHPMTERSSSHKSDGRQSSAGQSTYSARASSFGYETRPLSASVPPFVPHGPPAGLFILGPVPSIIRCWLNENFRSEAMLYAAVCTGSYRSVVDSSLLSRLDYQDDITSNREGQRIIKLPVYLPEATLKTASSRSSSPAHQLPTLTTDFLVQDLDGQAGSMQIFLGCDVLRARNADIHFSLDRLTLFDDERNMVSVQLVRPENAAVYQSLQTTPTVSSQFPRSASAVPCQTDNDDTLREPKMTGDTMESSLGNLNEQEKDSKSRISTNAVLLPAASSPRITGEDGKSANDFTTTDLTASVTKTRADSKGSESLNNGTTPDTPTRSDSSNIWGSWRRDTKPGNGMERTSRDSVNSGYNTAGRGKGKMVLKPARLNTSRSSSIQQQPVGFEAGEQRAVDNPAERTESPGPVLDKKAASVEAKPLSTSVSSKPRSANPIGGASAFGWLNPSQAPRSATGTGD